MSTGYSSPPHTIEFNNKVWDIVRRIPYGKVSTYGRIASLISPPKEISPHSYYIQSPRWVGRAMASCPEDVPWQRVINSKGKISPRRGNSDALQKELLEAEGVLFDDNQRVDLAIFGWPIT